MKRRTHLIFWILMAIVVIAAIYYWGMYKLGKGLRTLPVGVVTEVFVGALSAQVICPRVTATNAAGGVQPLNQPRSGARIKPTAQAVG
jgi:hypothetical protein